MHLRNGPHGYGVVSKTLHWVTVVLLVVQVPLGFSMDWEDSSGERSAVVLADGGGDGRDDAAGRRDRSDDGSGLTPGLVRLHVTLGITLLLVGLTRIGWRLATPLPPWAEQLTARDKVLANWTERVLLASLILMPATGLVLIRSGDDDLLPLHVGSHVLLYTAVVLHVGLALRRRTLRRMLA